VLRPYSPVSSRLLGLPLSSDLLVSLNALVISQWLGPSLPRSRCCSDQRRCGSYGRSAHSDTLRHPSPYEIAHSGPP